MTIKIIKKDVKCPHCAYEHADIGLSDGGEILLCDYCFKWGND